MPSYGLLVWVVAIGGFGLAAHFAWRLWRARRDTVHPGLSAEQANQRRETTQKNEASKIEQIRAENESEKDKVKKWLGR